MPEEKSEEKKEAKKGITVNINKVIKKRNGDPVRLPVEFREEFEFCEACAKKVNEVKGDEMTIRNIIVDALDLIPRETPQGEKKLSATEKLRRGKLAGKVYDSIEPVELSVDDLSLIKKLIGEMQTPLVISQVFPEIDPKTGEDD